MIRLGTINLATLLSAVCAWTQTTSSLRGVVKDAGGAVMPGVAVTLTNAQTKAVRSGISDESGVYQFLQAAPGTYDLRAENPGFASVTRSGIVLQVNTPASLDLTMELGSVSEVVNVEASVPTVNTVDASIGNAFTEMQVRQLPLQTRNIVELLSIQPGVTPTGEVLGARRDQNNVTLDGADANDNQNSGINSATNTMTNGSNANGVPGEAGFNAGLPVPLDSVQEFRVTVGGQGANMGRSSGGQVSLVTKSGSNNYHGSLYEFHRNRATAANDWFSNRAGVERERLVRNQFGASLGGRIVRDRLFFFTNFEQRIDASARAETRNVPTEALRNGILSLRTSSGIMTLSPNEVTAADPLGIGYSSAMRQFLSFYPQGNDPNAGADRGLNFMGYRFNAPFRQDDKAYVAKLDFNLSPSHMFSWRGTLADNSQDIRTARFPGQEPAARMLNNSRGFASQYTAVLSQTLVNVASVGLTRIGMQQSGTPGSSLSFDGVDSQFDFSSGARSFGRIVPTWNVADDLNWTKGRHTVSTGVNFRFIRFDRNSQVNSYPSFSFSRNTLAGLGADVNTRVLDVLKARTGDAALRLTEAANVTRGMGVMLGLLNQYSATYNFDKTGAAVPLGESVARKFATNEYEFYLQDSWRTTSELTLTFGVRYSNFSVPYEVNGIQVGTTVGADVFFAERVGAMMAGTPNSALPNALLSYDLNGPANGRPSWYQRDNNNWAPRFGFAFSPMKEGLLSRIMGKGSVFRGGASLVYDRFGSDLVTEFDRTGSPGLSTNVTQPVNTDFTTAARYQNGLPALPTAPTGTFPFTPPAVVGGFGRGVGIHPNLVAPYSIVLNASYARELKGGFSMEVGYVGRLSRKNLIQVDAMQPLTRFRDPRSGQDWSQMSGALRDAYEAGLTPAQVKANPSLLPTQPWIENLAPGLQDHFYPGTAT
ncbi:MAG TPA: TonB-dependent receptor, partial [Bryobacteraceae bacterium]|nr:TonB-dependent receptor [Bryobacteraceae bacterium]